MTYESAGLAVKVPEKVALVPDGQGNPPEVLTGTLWLVNVAAELVLLHVPTTVADPAIVVQVLPRILAVTLRPFWGMISSPVGPTSDRPNCHVPLAVIVALAVNPLLLI